MRVLMLSYYYPPHAAVGATRAYLVSRHLAMRGHAVTVVAAEPQAVPAVPAYRPVVYTPQRSTF